MREHTRRAVAIVAGRLITGRDICSIFDNDQGQSFEFSGQVDQEKVSLYDHTEAAHMTGELPELYHHGNKCLLHLAIQGGFFAGRDDASGHKFSGSVSGSSIALYDDETKQHYLFVI